jgi:hypothetical protein
MKERIIGPLFFVEATVPDGVYLDVLEHFVYTQMADLRPNTIYQQDGAHPRQFVRSRNPRENLPGSLDWVRRTNLLAPELA